MTGRPGPVPAPAVSDDGRARGLAEVWVMSLYRQDLHSDSIHPVLGVYGSLPAAREDALETVRIWPGRDVLEVAQTDGYLEINDGPKILRLESWELIVGGEEDGTSTVPELPPAEPTTAALPP